MSTTSRCWTKTAPGVLKQTALDLAVGDADLALLSKAQADAPLRRARLCAHLDDDVQLQQMIISLNGESYIRPHKHTAKPESYQIVRGEAALVLFADDGTVAEIVHLTPPGKGGNFFSRLSSETYHSLVLISPEVVFCETTLGPFRRDATHFAPWAPAPDSPDCASYMSALKKTIIERLRI